MSFPDDLPLNETKRRNIVSPEESIKALQTKRKTASVGLIAIAVVAITTAILLACFIPSFGLIGGIVLGISGAGFLIWRQRVIHKVKNRIEQINTASNKNILIGLRASDEEAIQRVISEMQEGRFMDFATRTISEILDPTYSSSEKDVVILSKIVKHGGFTSLKLPQQSKILENVNQEDVNTAVEKMGSELCKDHLLLALQNDRQKILEALVEKNRIQEAVNAMSGDSFSDFVLRAINKSARETYAAIVRHAEFVNLPIEKQARILEKIDQEDVNAAVEKMGSELCAIHLYSAFQHDRQKILKALVEKNRIQDAVNAMSGDSFSDFVSRAINKPARETYAAIVRHAEFVNLPIEKQARILEKIDQEDVNAAVEKMGSELCAIHLYSALQHDRQKILKTLVKKNRIQDAVNAMSGDSFSDFVSRAINKPARETYAAIVRHAEFVNLPIEKQARILEYVDPIEFVKNMPQELFIQHLAFAVQYDNDQKTFEALLNRINVLEEEKFTNLIDGIVTRIDFRQTPLRKRLGKLLSTIAEHENFVKIKDNGEWVIPLEQQRKIVNLYSQFEGTAIERWISSMPREGLASVAGFDRSFSSHIASHEKFLEIDIEQQSSILKGLTQEEVVEIIDKMNEDLVRDHMVFALKEGITQTLEAFSPDRIQKGINAMEEKSFGDFVAQAIKRYASTLKELDELGEKILSGIANHKAFFKKNSNEEEWVIPLEQQQRVLVYLPQDVATSIVKKMSDPVYVHHLQKTKELPRLKIAFRFTLLPRLLVLFSQHERFQGHCLKIDQDAVYRGFLLMQKPSRQIFLESLITKTDLQHIENLLSRLINNEPYALYDIAKQLVECPILIARLIPFIGLVA